MTSTTPPLGDRNWSDNDREKYRNPFHVTTPSNDEDRVNIHGLFPEDADEPNQEPRPDALDDARVMQARPVAYQEPRPDALDDSRQLASGQDGSHPPVQAVKDTRKWNEARKASRQKREKNARAEREQLQTQNMQLQARNAFLEQENRRLNVVIASFQAYIQRSARPF